MPMIAGPGTMGASILLMTNTGGDLILGATINRTGGAVYLRWNRTKRVAGLIIKLAVFFIPAKSGLLPNTRPALAIC